MILIPVLLVLYLNDLKKYRDGREAFIQNYLMVKKRALDEAVAAIEADRECDPASLAAEADLPDDNARGLYGQLLAVLAEHYRCLLTAAGDDYDSMVREAYHNRTNYLLFFNRLNLAEKALNKALRSHLSREHEGVNDIIHSMQEHSEQIRRDISLRIFA
ncbi:MAG: hypothetical protein Kow0089_22590 [Desulfobulbaceae bacterium]